MNVRIGTRGSDLALRQARHVAARLEAAGCEVEIVVLKTRGDRIDRVPLHTIEGKAFFTAEIEAALLEGRVDLAVHSHKDLPVEGPRTVNGLLLELLETIPAVGSSVDVDGYRIEVLQRTSHGVKLALIHRLEQEDDEPLSG